jgi:hypothetical protein
MELFQRIAGAEALPKTIIEMHVRSLPADLEIFLPLGVS